MIGFEEWSRRQPPCPENTPRHYYQWLRGQEPNGWERSELDRQLEGILGGKPFLNEAEEGYRQSHQGPVEGVIVEEPTGYAATWGEVDATGDVLVHAGDLCNQGNIPEVRSFARWLRVLPHRHKVVIAGNHDWPFDNQAFYARKMLCQDNPGVRFLQGWSTELAVGNQTVTAWGGPWTPPFYQWAFMLKPKDIREKWRKAPNDVDILVTHGPPAGILDTTIRGDVVGCPELLGELPRIRPALHVFGHIHEGYGILKGEHTTYVNASSVDHQYRPVNPAIVVDL